MTLIYISMICSIAAVAAAKSLQSCPTLCDPIDCSPPGSPVPGILQARTLEWVAISFSNAWKWKVKVKSLGHVWLWLLATPQTAAYQAPPPMEFFRQEYWSGVPLPSPFAVLSTFSYAYQPFRYRFWKYVFKPISKLYCSYLFIRDMFFIYFVHKFVCQIYMCVCLTDIFCQSMPFLFTFLVVYYEWTFLIFIKSSYQVVFLLLWVLLFYYSINKPLPTWMFWSYSVVFFFLFEDLQF